MFSSLNMLADHCTLLGTGLKRHSVDGWGQVRAVRCLAANESQK
jgi:hypothetical protein